MNMHVSAFFVQLLVESAVMKIFYQKKNSPLIIKELVLIRSLILSNLLQMQMYYNTVIIIIFFVNKLSP